MNGAEIYDPATQHFQKLSVSMATARHGHSAVPLPYGRVLNGGGQSGSSRPIVETEIYSPRIATFVDGPTLDLRHGHGHSADLLPNGNVLVAGGITGTISSDPGVEVVQIAPLPMPSGIKNMSE